MTAARREALRSWISEATAHPSEQRLMAANRIGRALREVRPTGSLSLSDLNLRTLPPVVCELPNLRHIHVGGNPLRSLPPSLSSLGPECFLHGLDARHLPMPVVAELCGDAGTWRGPTVVFAVGSLEPYRQQLLALDPEHDPPTLASAISGWLPADSPELAAWQAFNDDAGASGFAELLTRLAATQDGRGPLLAPRVREVLVELGRTEDLRATCFAVAQEALETCNDRVALAFEQMEAAIVDHQAQRGDLSGPAILELAQRKFRLATLDDIATETIGKRPDSDEVEIRLAYRVMLKDRLDLPGKTDSMLYPRVAGLTEADLTQAVQAVTELESGEKMLDFICSYAPWKSHLQRVHADVFKARLSEVADEKETLAIKPDTMTEAHYMEQCRNVMDREQAIQMETVRSLTRHSMPAATTH